MNIAIVSLGCPKNQADADVFCRSLLEAGHHTVPTIEQADAVIINTCGFIQSAKEEAIESILEACQLKANNPAVKVIVTGCLAERYQKEVAKEIPEVDAVVGIGSNQNLVEILAELDGKGATQPALERYGAKKDLPLGGARVIGTPGHYAWLKISEGCSNACSYCAIPLIRGPLRSREMQDCVQEARWLAEQGVRELVLVAQDVTAFGDDRGENQIVPLLRELEKIEGLHWIRLLYAYPERITPQLLDCMAESDKIVPYLDLPIQHINDEILRSMRRKGSADSVRKVISLIHKKLPHATLRTTLIAGYPGESEQQFAQLLDFVAETKFDRLGCFAYSEEEGTAAALLEEKVPENERARRVEAVMNLQANIMANKLQEQIGCVLEVVCDAYDEENEYCLCRSAADAPEIDANVLVKSEEPLRVGSFYKVRVVNADVYDLYAEFVENAE